MLVAYSDYRIALTGEAIGVSRKINPFHSIMVMIFGKASTRPNPKTSI